MARPSLVTLLPRVLAWTLASGLLVGCPADDAARPTAVGAPDAAAGQDASLPFDVEARPDAAPLDASALPPDSTPPEDASADATEPPPFDPLPLVDLFVGTGAMGFNVGALQPGATTPFGMVRLSPDTGDEHGAALGVFHAGGYRYEDPWILGFSYIHLVGTGVADYGNLLVAPAVGSAGDFVTWEAYRFAHDPAREHAEPGYYRVEAAERGVTAELTATPRTGLHRYTFPATEDALLVVDVTHTLGEGIAGDSAVTVDAATGELHGFVHNVGEFSKRYGGFRLYFVIAPSRPPTGVGVFDAQGYRGGETEAGGAHSGAVLRFDARQDPEVVLRVGISFVDEAGARQNLAAEATGRSFDDVRAAAAATWRDALLRVTVEGGTDTRRGLLYTALYHAQLMPTLLTDTDGRYRGLDQEVHTAEGFTYYSDLSMWDTYRTFHPLAALLFPDRQLDFLRSLVAMARDGGGLPRWPLATGYTGSMIGTSADIVIGHSVALGQTDFDVAAAYDAARVTAMGPAPAGHPGRDRIAEYMTLGWVPSDLANGSVSKTLEYTLDDYCLARVADHLGRTEDRALLDARSGNWKALYDPVTGFLAPRRADGTFEPYTPEELGDHYTEGTAWHYLFMVPHDVPGLVTVLGGPEAFTDRLSSLMSKGRDAFQMLIPNSYYWHGNEPIIASPWLFGFAGRPELSRGWVQWVADSAYQLEPGGLAGNDDGGTLSSWWIFAAAGFYPLPCTGEYVLGAPLFDRVHLALPGGALEVRLDPDPAAPPRLNDAAWTAPTVPHSALLGGATLTLPAPPAGAPPAGAPPD